MEELNDMEDMEDLGDIDDFDIDDIDIVEPIYDNLDADEFVDEDFYRMVMMRMKVKPSSLCVTRWKIRIRFAVVLPVFGYDIFR